MARYTGWTRDDWIALLARLTDGFVRRIPAGGSPAAARLPSVAPGDPIPAIEGFARMSVVWAAWLREPSNPPSLTHAGRRHDVASLLARGLVDATDPSHAAWWGPIGDRDQRIVEAAEVATAILLAGERLRAAVESVDRGAFDRLLDWLALVDGRDVWPDNWVLFPMMSALARRASGREIADRLIDEPVDWMFARHVGDGWYTDGPGHALDLYTGWAIHWHLLWWATIDGARRPRVRHEVIRRARAWLAGFAPLVAADGSYPRFGRSLGYRFAVAAPFVQAALLELDPLAPGVARRLASGVVRHSLEVGALDPTTDWFRLGVGGERPQVVERYVSPGSVAWAAHAFVTLAMPPDHPFWAAPEAALPADDGPSGELAATGAGLLATWSGTTGETHLYNARNGHPADIPGHDYSAGYGKLAYHSAFPFDLPIEAGAAPGADSAIVALEPDGNMWRVAHRNETLRGSAGPGWIWSTYLLPTRSGPTRLTTVVLLIEGVEVRVSAVHPAGSLRLREGGAALGLDGGQRVRIELGDGGGLILIGDGGRTVGIRALIGHDAAGSEETTPERANLVQERACHPYVEESSPSDRERVVASASIATARDGDLRGTLEAIDARVEGDDVTVTWPSGSAIVSFGRRPPATRPVAAWTIRGSALRVVRASLDGSSFAGEMIATIDGAVRLDRPGTLAINRHETDVDVTVASGFRLDAAWAGPDLIDLAIRHGAGPFEPLGRLTEPGTVPDALVRRLKRRLGTRLVTLRLGRE